jgi:hypothetical protein
MYERRIEQLYEDYRQAERGHRCNSGIPSGSQLCLTRCCLDRVAKSCTAHLVESTC